MTELTILTDDNYYSDKTYMSVSRFKEYMKCEARAKAIDDGVWDDERDQKPLLFGNYVHSYFESEEAHEKFKEDNKMKNGQTILGSRYTDEIKNNSATASKMFNLSKKLENDNLREIHKALYGLLTAGYDISNMRNVEELEKYVNVKKSHGKLLDVTNDDIELYHKLFVARFGK